jgi:hypothetical protein
VQPDHCQGEQWDRDERNDPRPVSVDQPPDDGAADNQTQREVNKGARNLAAIPAELALERLEEDADAVEQQWRGTHRYSEQRGDQDEPAVGDFALPLVDRDYVESTSKGVFIKELKVWCQMLERAVTWTTRSAAGPTEIRRGSLTRKLTKLGSSAGRVQTHDLPRRRFLEALMTLGDQEENSSRGSEWLSNHSEPFGFILVRRLDAADLE